FRRVHHIGCEAIEASEHEPIDVVEDEALGRLALQHIELMTKNENFSVQRSARPEQPGHKAPNQPTDIAHNIEYHPIRRRSSAIWVCGRDTTHPIGSPTNPRLGWKNDWFGGQKTRAPAGALGTHHADEQQSDDRPSCIAKSR